MTKRILTLIPFTIFLLINFHCAPQEKSIGQKTGNGAITGEGEIVTKEISLDAIHGFKLHTVGEVVLTQGSPQKVVIEGQQNIIDNITHSVNNGIWEIDFDKDVRNAKPVTIHITLSTLDKAEINGSGKIRSATKFTGLTDLNLSIAGSGHTTLEYDASKTDLDLNGSGKVNLSGTSNTLSISIDGSGNVMADQLIVENCDVHISGSGNAFVNVNKNLDTSISGSGNVRYLGNAHVNTKINGSGVVTQVNQ